MSAYLSSDVSKVTTNTLMKMKTQGERIAMLEARKHLVWYLKGVRGTKKLKAKISALTSLDQLDGLIQEALEAAGATDCG